MNLKFEVIEKGWAKAIISDSEKEIVIFGSYLSDGLFDLIMNAYKLANGEKETFCSWQEEPGQYRWLFTREKDEIKLKILWFEDTFSNLKNEKGNEEFCGSENIIKFIRKIIREFDKLKYEYGTEEYKRIWTYDFPEEQLNRLKNAFQTLKNKECFRNVEL